MDFKYNERLLKATGNFLSDRVLLAPDNDFQEAQEKALSAITMLDIATTAITIQPDFKDLQGVDDLKAHQADSKADAKKWRNEVRPVLFSVNDAIINFSTEFTNLYTPLFEFAGQLKEPQEYPDAQSNLVAGLQNLQSVLRTQKNRVDLAVNEINSLRQSMLIHESALSGDLTEIKAKYEGDQGKIKDIENIITSYQDAMQNDLGIIGFGAAGVVVGGLVAAVGVAMWLESAGGSTPVIAIGIGIIVAGSGAGAYGIYDYNKSSNSKAEAIRELATINTEIAVAKSLTCDVSALIGHLDQASGALKKLADGWGQLDRDYQNLIDALENTQGNTEKNQPLAFIVQANLRSSKQQWEILLEDANTVKENLLSPMTVDTSALDNSDGKHPVKPNAPVEPEKENMLQHAHSPAPSSQQTAVELKNTGYQLWVENTVKSVFSFEKDLNNLIEKKHTPQKITEANKVLTENSKPAIVATNSFISTLEDLSKTASILRKTAQLGDDKLIAAAEKAFEAISVKVLTARDSGQSASDKVSILEGAVGTVDAALGEWLSDMKSKKTHDKQILEDATRLRDKALQNKQNIKNDYWWCLLGPVACAVVTIEAVVRINNAQSEINAYNARISKLDKSLSELLTSINDTTSLSCHADILYKCIDGGLTALQTIKVAVDGINATIPSLTPFVIRGHLNAVADQIDGAGSICLNHSSHMLFRELAIEDDEGLIETLQSLSSAATKVQFSAWIASKQPKLVAVENLLKQDQQLLFGHTLEWLTSYSNNVLSQFSAIGTLGDSIQYLGNGILTQTNKGDMTKAVSGIDSIVDSISALMESRLGQDSLCIRLFNENIKNDQNRFNTVADVLRKQLGGRSGELAKLESKESAYTAEISQSLDDIVNNSTRVICENLAWGAVIAITIGTGQVAFAGSAAPTLTYLVKKGANLSLKAASDAIGAQAKAELKKIERRGENIDQLVEERSVNLENICKLNTDMAVLKVLVDDLINIKNQSILISKFLDDIKRRLNFEIHDFYTIKYALNSSNPSEGVDKLKKHMEEWSDISKASNLLEKSFMAVSLHH